MRTEKDRTAGTENAHPDVLQLQNKLSSFFGCLSFSSFYHHEGTAKGKGQGRASSVLSQDASLIDSPSYAGRRHLAQRSDDLNLKF